MGSSVRGVRRPGRGRGGGNLETELAGCHVPLASAPGRANLPTEGVAGDIDCGWRVCELPTGKVDKLEKGKNAPSSRMEPGSVQRQQYVRTSGRLFRD
jgi:hypothetical protein